MAYAGPVISYYQKTTNQFKRLTDEEWATMVTKDSLLPERPDWLNYFLTDSKGLKRNSGRVLDGIQYSTAVKPLQKKSESDYLSACQNGNAITLMLPQRADLQIKVFDLRGRLVMKPLKTIVESGRLQCHFPWQQVCIQWF